MKRFKFLRTLIVLLFFNFCASINDEGRALSRFKERVELDPHGALLDWDEGALDPCFWFGVECFDGKVVSLNLKDLCLKGTLSPELGKLIHMKSLILQNNSFYGIVPREIGDLHKLEVLDLRRNNLSGPLPSDLGNILSLEILEVRGNRFIRSIPLKLKDLIHEDLLCSEWGCERGVGGRTIRRLLQVGGEDRVWHHKNDNDNNKPHASTAAVISPSAMTLDAGLAPSLSPSLSPLHAPAASPASPSSVASSSSSPSLSPFLLPSPSVDFATPAPSPSPTIEPPSALEPKFNTESPSPSALPPILHKSHPSVPLTTEENSIKPWKIYMPIAVGVSFLLVLSVIYLVCCRANRVVTVRPWATGLSGQLQKAFVTGVPALKRSELETACEDFSNIIGSLSDCKLYKGTLSSGVEIAVVSTVVTAAKYWSKQSESQFRKKISVLSKVNHKNFVNLLGYCAEQEPFTRMMVFEYAPNGTLFEHLHVKEAEDLDWGARLRIAMGIAYCLDHMHQLNPPVILETLDSLTIYLTDDYASKVGDISFRNGMKETKSQSLDDILPCRESIVYKFGMLMLEILSGRAPLSEENGLPEPWLSSYLNGTISVRDFIDPALGSFREEDIGALFEVIRSCINPDPNCRPAMAQVATKLKDITSMSPNRATPKVSPLWWAEIEILSSEAN